MRKVKRVGGGAVKLEVRHPGRTDRVGCASQDFPRLS